MTASLSTPYRLIALDLDGTLTSSEKMITPRTFAALMRAQEAGVRLVLASGRPTKGIVSPATQLQLEQYGGFVLSFNGGRILDWHSRATVYRRSVDLDLIRPVFDLVSAHGLSLVSYLPEHLLVVGNDSPYLQEESRINGMPVAFTDHFVEEASAIVGGPPKFLVPGPPDEILVLEREAKALLGNRMEITRSAPYFLEFMSRGIDKGLSLARLLEHLGWERTALMAFGDGCNDLSMIRFAGMGVAMANAADELKAAADVITRSNDEDGVADIVERFVLSPA